ncbi:hypothetical protein EJ03DRAFT_249579, partial [Teratosphaeria nubilosa]
IIVDQRLFRTEKDRLGIGNRRIFPSQEIIVLEGGRMPFIAHQTNEGPLSRRLVSEAYVRGIMHGEAVP